MVMKSAKNCKLLVDYDNIDVHFWRDKSYIVTILLKSVVYWKLKEFK